VFHIKNISNVKVIEGKGTGNVWTEILNLREKNLISWPEFDIFYRPTKTDMIS